MSEAVEAHKPALPEVGLHPKTPEAEYRLWPAANYSTLKEFQYTPLHVYQSLTDPPASTPPMDFGTALHTAILQPDSFEQQYVRGAAGNLTRKGPKEENSQIKANNPDKELIRDADWPKITAIKRAVWTHPRASEVLSGRGFNELAYLWRDPATDLDCKARVDRLGMSREGWPCVVDLKSFGEKGGRLTQRAIESVIWDRQYHVQAAHYLNGLNAIEPCQRRYILLLIEKKPPYGVRLVEIDFAALELGRRQLSRWLAQYKQCQDSGEWPGWSGDFDPMGVPPWAYSQEEADEE